MLDAIIQAMKDEINKHGLELMKHYPDDLLIHDRDILSRIVYPGATVGWMVGHLHSHIVILGIHPKENEAVTYYTNLSKDDRFYLLKVGQDSFTLTDVGREQFPALQKTAVPYRREGNNLSFWLFHHHRQIGYCKIDRTGPYQAWIYKAEITPMKSSSELDKAALRMWASYAITAHAQSLFAKSEIVFNEPVALAA